MEFGPGLNILTGETGAGKSLLMGSVGLALGGKFEKEMLRRGAESALVELVFRDHSKKVTERLKEMELEVQKDGIVIISRRLQAGKSLCKINGETVTARQVRELAETLLDLHGQHDHQSLLHKKNHLDILDEYCGQPLADQAREVERLYQEHKKAKARLMEETLDQGERARQQALAEFEWQEIEQAKPVVGEDEELERRYRRMVNGKRILESLTESYQYTGGDFETGAGSALGRALRALKNVSGFDEEIEGLEEQLTQIDSLLADYNRELKEYMDGCEFDEADFAQTEARLNVLNHLKSKYGGSLEAVCAYGQKCRALLDRLGDYETYLERLRQEEAASEGRLRQACEELSCIRREHAGPLARRLKESLRQLNFPTVEFVVSLRPGQALTARGGDEVEFLFAANPGESLMPLSQAASGGELSRIMLAIKTVLAGKDQIQALIFDEIDAGISGRTAWRVAEQLSQAARSAQVICITHLPQIAAMADCHFVIEKSSSEDYAITDIRPLQEEESLKELARLLGSDELTEAALSNAREMRRQAKAYKNAQTAR